MLWKETVLTTKDGRELVLRCARKEDAPALLEGFLAVCDETPFLTRDSAEAGVGLTAEGEESFIESSLASPDSLMLLAFVDGEYAGNGSLNPVMNGFRRFAHRCSFGIALLEQYCGFGVGRALMTELLHAAKDHGFELAELEVVESNERALRLYRSLGFQTVGRYEEGMKYPDGSYVNLLYMRKPL